MLLIGLFPIFIIYFYSIMEFRTKIKNFTDAPISRSLILDVLKDYKRPNDKISELVKSGQLMNLKRGMYIAGKTADLPSPSPFLIANHLRGPSYVSLETALSYWGAIPERVYEISSCTLKTTKSYKNTVGRFTYQNLPMPYYCFGIKHITLSERQTALMASVEKALCDKVVLTSGVFLRSISQTESFLLEDLRMEEHVLQQLDLRQMSTWVSKSPKKNSIKLLIKTIEGL